MLAKRKFSREDTYKFFQVVQRYIKVGLSPNDSIERYVESVGAPELKEIGKQLLKDMQNGLDFAAALRKIPEFCPAFLVGLLEVGQKSGQLNKILDEIVFHLEQELDISRKVNTALLVPKITCLGMLAAGSFALLVVIPLLGDLLKDLQMELPLATRIVIAIGDTARTFWWLTILLPACGISGYRCAKKKFSDKASLLALKIPFYKVIAYTRLQYNFSKVMGLCINAGIRPQEALRYTAVAVDNVYLKSVLDGAADDMANTGNNIANAIERKDKLKIIDKDFYLMLHTGSESGNLGDIMSNESENYRKAMLAASETIGDKVGLSVTIPGYIALILLFIAIEVPIISMLQNIGSVGGGM